MNTSKVLLNMFRQANNCAQQPTILAGGSGLLHRHRCFVQRNLYKTAYNFDKLSADKVIIIFSYVSYREGYTKQCNR